MAVTKKNSRSASWDLSQPWIWYLAAGIILAVVTIAAYYPSLHYDFQFDDLYNIKKHFHLRIQSFRDWAFNGARWISYSLNAFHYSISKFDPFIYRRSNLIFHISSGLLLFTATILGLSTVKNNTFIQKRALPIAFLTALLFLLHPVQTQTVSYVIQGQLEGLALLFMMAILVSYVFYCRATSLVAKIALLWLVTILGILSCGTKEIAILSPVMLLLFDWFFIAQGQVAELKKRIFFFIGYSALIVIQYVRYLNFPFLKNSFLGTTTLKSNVGNLVTEAPGALITPYNYCITQFKVITHYIFMYIWPFSLSVDYDWTLTRSFFSAACLVPLLFLLLLLAGTGYLLYKNKTDLVAFCSLWFFIGLAPRSTIIPSTEIVADYKTYFSSFGILLLLAIGLVYCYSWLLTKFKSEEKTFIPFIAAGSLLGLLAFATYERNKVWESGESFWMNVITNAPRKARAYNNYAVAIAEHNRHAEAIPFLRKAIKLDKFYPDPWSNIAVCYATIGQLDVAIDCLKQAVKINPNYPEFYNNLSSFLLQKGRFAECKEVAQEAIRIRPHYGKAYFNWGQALYAEGNIQEAFEKVKYACLKADYDVFDAFKLYAQLAVELKKYDDAVIGYSTLHALQPDNRDALFNTANAHYFAGNPEEAKKIYRHLAETFPDEHRSWFNLAESLMDEGNYKEAIDCYEKSREVMQAHIPNFGKRVADAKNKYVAAVNNRSKMAGELLKEQKAKKKD